MAYISFHIEKPDKYHTHTHTLNFMALKNYESSYLRGSRSLKEEKLTKRVGRKWLVRCRETEQNF